MVPLPGLYDCVPFRIPVSHWDCFLCLELIPENQPSPVVANPFHFPPPQSLKSGPCFKPGCHPSIILAWRFLVNSAHTLTCRDETNLKPVSILHIPLNNWHSSLHQSPAFQLGEFPLFSSQPLLFVQTLHTSKVPACLAAG